MEPLVSVIVPLFNAELFIADTLNSALSQSYRNWELIIINDASTDKSREIAEGFAGRDKRIKIINLNKNSGLPAKARNVGISNAGGKYISFLDADDLWLKDKLKIQVEFMEKEDDVFMLYARSLKQKNGKVVPILAENYKLKSGYIFRELFLSNDFIACNTVMFRNRGDKNYYFDENKELRAIEDFDLWLRISRQERISFINQPLAIYRVHKNSTSEGLRPLILRHLALIKKWGNFVDGSTLLKKYLLFLISMPLAIIKNEVSCIWGIDC